MADDGYAAEHVAEQFNATMSAVKRFFDREQYQKALPHCNRALGMRPDCPVARRSRIFALMNLSRWTDARQACEKLACPEDQFLFERAYCLYRLNKFSEALEVLKQDKACNTAPHKKLEAQVRYRMGDYDACANMYEDLYAQDPDDSGLLVNALASHVSGDAPREAMQLMDDHEDLLTSSYELCFNLACALIDEGKLDEALARLEEAKELCKAEILEDEEVTEEEAADLDFHEDLATISVQQAVVLQRRGGPEDQERANEIYERVLRRRMGGDREIDVTVLAVASNNAVSTRAKGKLIDALKRISVASKESLDHKLTRRQRMDIAVNKIVLLLQGSRMEEARRDSQRLAKDFPGNPRVAVAQAAVADKEKKSTGAEEVFQAYLAAHPDDEEVRLCLSQLHTRKKQDAQAAEVLAQLSSRSRAKPHIAKALVTMALRQKNTEQAVKTVRDAIAFWTKEGDSEKDLGAILRLAATVGEQAKDQALIADSFKLYLEHIDGSDTEALCGLIKAMSGSDPDTAEEYARRLKVPDWMVDPEELETQPIPKVSLYLRPGGGDGANDEGKKKKKKSKGEPEKAPATDPKAAGKNGEGKKGKKESKDNKNYLRCSQGEVGVEDGAFRKQGPSTAQIEVSKDTTMRPKGQGRKKGKK